jgi:2-polyprenyl-3-methyl-5-hydroxy-6-metoxy-1,4-benzoquinol methylase
MKIIDSGAQRDLNRDYYETPASGRDDYWRKMAAPRYRVAEIVTLLRKDPPRSLVDLGCGNGRLLEELSKRLEIPDLAGIDLSSSQIESNRRRDPSIDWISLDLEKPIPSSLPLAGRFGVVVASEILEHLTSPETFLRRAAELAEPRGRLILSTQSGPIRETERRVGHVRHFSPEETRALLERTGWRPLRVWNTGFPFHDLSKWWANLDPDGAMERFGDRPYGFRESLVAYLLRLAYTLNSRSRGSQLFAVAERAGSKAEEPGELHRETAALEK